MKIGIITNPIDEGHPSYSVYTYNLIKNLNCIDRENEYYLIHHTNINMDIYRANNDIIIPMPLSKPLKGLYWRYVLLPRELRYQNLEMIHDPRGIGLLPFNLPFKMVVTIQSLMSILYPRYNAGGWLAFKLFGRKTKDAERIITVSESLKREVIKYLKVPEYKINVIYNGKDDIFKPLNLAEIADARKKYNLGDLPFILYVGVLQPIKNIPSLIKAFYKLKNKIKHKLVIVGGKGWQYEEIFKTVKNLNLQKDVLFIGNVPNKELPPLYNAADVFVFPSLYEAFGIPPLEAMACGIPVITSNVSSLPEVVGDAGIMVDPYDVEGLANVIHNVLINDGLREYMIKKGLERAKLFSWKKCAKETLEVYNRVE